MRLYSSTRATRLLSPATRRFAPSHFFSTSTATIPAADEADTPFAPSPEHRALRERVCGTFAASEVEPQGLQFNREERFNMDLFKHTGELGLLGVTVDPDYGGAGMDAPLRARVHEEPRRERRPSASRTSRTRASLSTTCAQRLSRAEVSSFQRTAAAS